MCYLYMKDDEFFIVSETITKNFLWFLIILNCLILFIKLYLRLTSMWLTVVDQNIIYITVY